MEQREMIAKLLFRLAQALERSSTADLESVLQGRAALVISADCAAIQNDVVPQERRVKKRKQRSSKDLAGIGAQLGQLESREAGTTLLTRARLTRAELEQLARMMDLPVLREDDSDRLRHKIVEACIGARLNSQAIRGA